MKSYPTVVQVIEPGLNSMNITQRELAEVLGYKRQNIITMWKTGQTPVPLKVVSEMSYYIGVDPAYLMRVCLNEYHPDVLEAMDETLGHSITEIEQGVLSIFRNAVPTGDLRLSRSARKTLKETFEDVYESQPA